MMTLEQIAPVNQPRARKLAYYEIPGAPLRRFFFFRPTVVREAAPLAISVHGISRNAAAHAYRLMAEAERYGVPLLAPHFDKQSFGQYQQLIDPSTRVRADLALLDMIEAAGRLMHAPGGKILLFGFSGGAQFTHRFVLAHPQRVLSAVHVAAGWYTFPDAKLAYPRGVGCLDADGPARLDVDGALAVPQHVMVGEHDVERDGSLRRSSTIDRMQGRTRVERARNWVSAMSAAAHEETRRLTLTLLPGVAHDFIETVEAADLPARVFNCFAEDAGLKPVR